jgi:hypothetical protein
MLEAGIVAEVSERLIGDKACNSDGMDGQLLQEYGTEHRIGWTNPAPSAKQALLLCKQIRVNLAQADRVFV